MKYLWPSLKLDYKKIDSFIIKKKKSEINYKLELLDKIKIYPVFYILLLESADPRILLVIRKLSKLTRDNEYKVEKIINYDSRI